MVILCIVATSGGLEGGGLVFKTFIEIFKINKKVKKTIIVIFKKVCKKGGQPTTHHPLFIFTKFIYKK